MLGTLKNSPNWKARLSLGRLSAYPGIVLFTLLFANHSAIARMVLFPLDVISAVQQESVSVGMVVTLNSALRGTEGELLPSIGLEPRAIAPAMWLPSASQSISCSTQENGCRYDFRFSQSTIGRSTSALKTGVLDVTVTNVSKSNAAANYWVAWRCAPAGMPDVSTEGFLLETAKPAKLSKRLRIPTWNPASVWLFQGTDFLCGDRIVYSASEGRGWKRETWVRRTGHSYKDLTENSILGYTRFQQTFVPGASSSVRVIVPYRPLPKANRSRLEPLFHKPR